MQGDQKDVKKCSKTCIVPYTVTTTSLVGIQQGTVITGNFPFFLHVSCPCEIKVKCRKKIILWGGKRKVRRCGGTKAVIPPQTHNTSKTMQANFAHSSPLHLLEFVCHSCSLELIRCLFMSHAWKHSCHKPHLRPESKANTVSAGSIGRFAVHPFLPQMSLIPHKPEKTRHRGGKAVEVCEQEECEL